MKITVLGSGSAYSDLNRFNSAYLVEIAGLTLMIDCGSDALRALQKAGVNLFSIKDIFITHMHADHCGGLPAVLTAMHVQGRINPISIHIPSTQLEFVRSWFANLFIYNERWSFKMELLPLSAGRRKLAENIELEFVSTDHLEKYAESARKFGIDPLSFAVIIREEGKSFFFSSDFDSINEIDPYLNSSLAFVESAHPGLKDVAKISAEAGGRIFLTHVPQELESNGSWRKELNSKFGIKEINVVHDGQIFNL